MLPLGKRIIKGFPQMFFEIAMETGTLLGVQPFCYTARVSRCKFFVNSMRAEADGGLRPVSRTD